MYSVPRRVVFFVLPFLPGLLAFVAPQLTFCRRGGVTTQEHRASTADTRAQEDLSSTTTAAAASAEAQPNMTKLDQYRGAQKWKGLIPAENHTEQKPREWDEGFRQFLLKYGMFNHVVYDVYIEGSKDGDYEEGELHNRSRFGNNLTAFRKEGLQFNYVNKLRERKVEYDFSEDYEVVANIVASPRSVFMTEHNWFGFVARSVDKTELVIVFRGTLTVSEWIENATFYMVQLNGEKPESGLAALWNHKELMVHSGFQQLYAQAPTPTTESPQQTVRRMVELNKGTLEKITIVGHSLGGAMSQLAAVDLVHYGVSGDIPVTVVTFAPPKIGNAALAARVEELGGKLRILRVRNPVDTVCNLPPDWFFGMTAGGYKHMGTELNLGNAHLRKLGVIRDEGGANHNLQMYLYNIDPSRDVALMNKNGNPIPDEYAMKHNISPYWHSQTWPRTTYE